MKPALDTLTIDPIAMNVTNRVASGSVLAGEHVFEGGVLVQGQLSGQVQTRGRLIVWQGGVIKGRFQILGDLYLFGQIGELGAAEDATVVECLGTAYIASTGVCTGTLMAQRLRLYEGADLQGPFKTLKVGAAPPVLQPGVLEAAPS